MKVNEVPEKLYFFEGEPILSVRSKKREDANVEYTRTDAFIEKAKKWFERQNEWHDINGNRHCDMEDFEDFKKAMGL